VATANGLTTSTTLQLWPGLTLLEDPGVLLTIPGLLVNVAKAEYDAKAKSISVTATVEMMCGCPITPQQWTTPPDTEPYWPSYAFAVSATIDGAAPFPLACTDTNTFNASIPLSLASGTREILVTARQPAESNSGYATFTLTV